MSNENSCNQFPNLMSPFKIGNVTIKNRMCVAPMGSGGILETVGYHSEISDRGIEYFVQRAAGGFGLCFIGGDFLPDNKVDEHDPFAAILNYPAYFRKQALALNEKCAYYDMKIFPQLSFGLGRDDGFLACSETPQFMNPDEKCTALTTEQVKQKVDCVIEAAKLCQDSGFPGIEVHAIHWGYLLDEFAMSLMNNRTDEYGGSLENRLRAAKELIEGIKQVCGKDYPVTMRLGLKSYIKGFNRPSLTGEEEAGRTLEEGIRIARMLEQYGYDALSVDTGTYDSFYYACPPQYMPYGHVIPLAEECKKAVNIPVLCGSRMNDPVMSEKALAEGKIDAVVLGRPSLADPQYANKVAMGRPEKIRPCIGCIVGCMGKVMNGEAITCAVNPAARNELNYGLEKTLDPKKVAVVGGGVAGMEAARTAKLRGFDVTIYEKSDRLGGLLNPAGAHGFKKDIHQLVEWYKREIEELGIGVEYHTEINADKMKEIHPDIAIIAIGSKPIMPRIEGIEHPKCSSGVDVLDGKVKLGNDLVVVGGGLVGCETAIDYAMQGKKVTLVEAMPSVLAASKMIPIMVEQMIPDLLEHHKVNIMTGYKIEAINDNGAVVTNVETGEKTELKADNVIMSIGMSSIPPKIKDELYGSGIKVFSIGDCSRVGNVYTSVHSAYAVARYL